MERFGSKAIDIINELHTERLDYTSEYLPLIDAAQRLDDLESVLGDYSLERLEQLIEADRDGRCVVLPVKPKETFYTIDKVKTLCHLGYYFDEYDCQGCEEVCDSKLDFEVRKNSCYNKSQVLSFMESQKKIYISEQEAESALKAMKESENDG